MHSCRMVVQLAVFRFSSDNNERIVGLKTEIVDVTVYHVEAPVHFLAPRLFLAYSS